MAEQTALLKGVKYPQPFDDLAVQMAGSATRHVFVISPRLDYRVFDNQNLTSALSALVKRSRSTEVRILIADSRPLLNRGHRLLELARRLPTSIKIRKLDEHPRWGGETVVIGDRDSVLFKPADANHEAFFQPNSPATARQYLELFTELWNCGSDDIELRSLRV